MKRIVGLVACVVLLSGCGGEPDYDARQGEIQAWLEANGSAPKEAQCLAVATRENFDVSDFEELDEATADPSAEPQDGLFHALSSAREKCAR